MEDFIRIVHASWTPHEQRELYRRGYAARSASTPDDEFMSLWLSTFSMADEFTFDVIAMERPRTEKAT